MNINQAKFNEVAETAKSAALAAHSSRWLSAIDRAVEGILSGDLIVTTLQGGAMVTSPRGTYRAGESCQCRAYQYGHKECRHRAASRLVELYEGAAN